MVHDEFCEMSDVGIRKCQCASRAYEKDPLPGVINPYTVREDNFDEWMAH